MSYEPTIWQELDIITADKLNKLENGVASAGGGAESPIFWITLTFDSAESGNPQKDMVCDTTYEEIVNAMNEGKMIMAIIVDENGDNQTLKWITPLITPSLSSRPEYEIIDGGDEVIIRTRSINFSPTNRTFSILGFLDLVRIPM